MDRKRILRNPLVWILAAILVYFTFSVLFDDTRGYTPVPTSVALGQIEQGKMTKALVEDRERIGRDLHDSVIQRLFATALSLQALVRLVEPVDGAPERVQEAVGELDATIRDIRSTIFALQAERSGTGGVRERILAVAADASRALGFRPHVSFEGIIDANVDDAVAENLVLTLREALTNVARHARARSVAVTIAVADDVQLDVTDDGAGFDPALTPPGEGLRNMRERARQLGGEIEIASGPGRGTVIRWQAPLPRGS